MNTLVSPSRFAVTSPPLKPGVPFSSRLWFGAKATPPAVVMGNRAYVRAWQARRDASVTPSARGR